METQKICAFFGHREIEKTNELYQKTYDEIVKVINLGCVNFYFGGYGEFDELCYQIVSKIKLSNPNLNITRTYCVSQEKFLYKKVRFFNKENYENVIYLTPSFDGWYQSIYFRTLAMIDVCDFIIFYVTRITNSGAYKAYQYAIKQKDKVVINIAN